MKILHLLAGGNIGGIEILMKDYAKYSKHENHFMMLWGKDGAATKLIRDTGSIVIELQLNSMKALKGFKVVERYCIENGIDTVIVHHAAPLSHLYLMWVKYRFSHIKTVAYAHGNAVDMRRDKDRRGLKIRSFVLAKSLEKADCVVAISNSVANSLVDIFGTRKEKIKVIYNGTDLKIYNNIKKTEQNAEIQIIYVGRLIKDKGVQLTLQALKQIKTDRNWHFCVVGDGSYRTELEKMCENFDLNRKVTFLGERLNIPQLLAEADIFVHMPFGEEGFGITIVEAMATGLVCVCGAVGGIPEIIEDGVNGYLVPKHDVEALVAKLEYLIDNIDECKIRSDVTRTAVNKFGLDVFVDSLDKLVEGYLTKN